MATISLNYARELVLSHLKSAHERLIFLPLDTMNLIREKKLQLFSLPHSCSASPSALIIHKMKFSRVRLCGHLQKCALKYNTNDQLDSFGFVLSAELLDS